MPPTKSYSYSTWGSVSIGGARRSIMQSTWKPSRPCSPGALDEAQPDVGSPGVDTRIVLHVTFQSGGRAERDVAAGMAVLDR